MRLGKRVIKYGLIVILAALAGCKGDHGGKGVSQLPVAQVWVQEVAEQGIGAQFEVAGTVQAVERALIAPRVSGQIVQLPAAIGSRVRKGDLLVKLNAAEISAQVLQARAQLEQVRRNLAREEKLLQQEASTPETVRALLDQARIAEAAVQEVTTMMEYATITAPFAGAITRKIANVGDLASPGVVLLELENDQLLQVVAQVPEKAVLRVRKGDVLPVTVPAAGVTVSGTVAEVSSAADPVSRTAQVKIDLEPGADLRSGQFARVTLEGVDEKSLLVSERAVQPFGQMERVFLVEEAGQTAGPSTIARLRLVRTGARYDGQVEILAGLTAGDRVVVNGGEKLRDGQPLELQAGGGRGLASEKKQGQPLSKETPVPSAPGMEKGRP